MHHLVIAEDWLKEKNAKVFLQNTAMILAGLPVQYVIYGLTVTGIVNLYT